jgi:hypothetical protein
MMNLMKKKNRIVTDIIKSTFEATNPINFVYESSITEIAKVNRIR